MPDLRDHIRRRLALPASPAAGSNLTVVVPGTEVWAIESLAFRFTADATVATRTIGVAADDQTSTYFRTVSTTGITASQARFFSAWHGAPSAVAQDDTIVIAFPDVGLILQPGHRLLTRIVGIQAGDQIDQVALHVVAYPTGPRVTPLPGVELLAEPRDGLEAGVPAYATP